MNFHVLTLFPEMIQQGVNTSITGRAIRQGIIGLNTVNIRDFSADKHKRVDDYTYGGGAGMLMQPQPVYDAWKSVAVQPSSNEVTPQGAKEPPRKVRTIYVTPQGYPFTQKMAEDLATSDELIFICGHYEGIDERVLEEVVTDYVSIGDYVLTGGELAAMVMIDAISRLVPGVLHNEVSADTESFHGNLLEYPQYSRPEEWHGRRVPEVLLSGNQKQVDAWRLEQSKARTRERRPDLYALYEEQEEAIGLLMKNKMLHMDMISQIRRGTADLYQLCHEAILLKDRRSGCFYYTNPAHSAEADQQASEYLCVRTVAGDASADGHGLPVILHQMESARYMEEKGIIGHVRPFAQAVLTRREKLPVTGLYRPDGKPTRQGITIREVEKKGMAYAVELLVDGSFCGSAAIDMEGKMVLGEIAWPLPTEADVPAQAEEMAESGRPPQAISRNTIVKALETCLCNHQLEQGLVSYIQYDPEAEEIHNLQKELGLYQAQTFIYR